MAAERVLRTCIFCGLWALLLAEDDEDTAAVCTSCRQVLRMQPRPTHAKAK